MLLKQFFHSQAHSDDIPLKLPKLEINTTTIVRESVIKFLGVPFPFMENAY